MSHSDRDARGGHAVRHFDTYSCGCCPILSSDERSAERATRKREAARDLREAEGDLLQPTSEEPGLFFEDHVYDGERCIRCGVNCYDAMLYGPEICPGRRDAPPLVYTTSSGDPSVFDEPYRQQKVDL